MTKLVLLVEDEESDVLFMRIAMERAKVENSLAVAKDGREAIAYLEGAGEFGNRQEHPLPGLVLLDLRLPRVPGLEVLTWIRRQPHLARLPVIVLSSSNQDSDVDSAYRSGADAFVVKPLRPVELLEIVRRIKQYWLDTDGPPPNCEDWLSVTVPRPTPESSG
ncbi:MAG: response regulator [Limisphaerales bacterium]